MKKKIKHNENSSDFLNLKLEKDTEIHKLNRTVEALVKTNFSLEDRTKQAEHTAMLLVKQNELLSKVLDFLIEKDKEYRERSNY